MAFIDVVISISIDMSNRYINGYGYVYCPVTDMYGTDYGFGKRYACFECVSSFGHLQFYNYSFKTSNPSSYFSNSCIKLPTWKKLN